MELTDEVEGLHRNIVLTKKGINRKIESKEFPKKLLVGRDTVFSFTNQPP